MRSEKRRGFLIILLLCSLFFVSNANAAEHQLFKEAFFNIGNRWEYDVTYSMFENVDRDDLQVTIVPVGSGFDFSSGKIVDMEDGDIAFTGNSQGVYVDSFSETGISSVYGPIGDYFGTQTFLPPPSDWRSEGTVFNDTWDYRGGGARWFKTKEGRYAITAIIDANGDQVSLQWGYLYGNFEHAENVLYTGTIVLEAKERKIVQIPDDYECTVFHLQTDVPDLGSLSEEFSWHLSPSAIQQVVELAHEDDGDDVLTAINNNPLELIPLVLDDSASDLYLGDGDYDESDRPLGTYDIDAHITYLSNESVDVPAGTFPCVKFQVVYHYEQDDGEEGINTDTYWTNPDIGIIKAIINDREYPPHGDVTCYETEFIWELTTINLAGDLNFGLVAHYPMDGDALDATDNDNNGAIENGVTFGEGVIGQCAMFDGLDDEIVIPSTDTLKLEDSFTISAWAYPTGYETNTCSHILSKSNNDFYGGGRNYELDFCHSTDFAVRDWSMSGGVIEGVRTSDVNALNKWYHIVGVYDHEGHVQKIYRNGKLINTRSTVGDTDIVTNDSPLKIGYGEIASHFGHFIGKIDEVRIYNRVLTDGEISTLASQGMVMGQGAMPWIPLLLVND